MRHMNADSRYPVAIRMKNHPWISVGFLVGAAFAAFTAIQALVGPNQSVTGFVMFAVATAAMIYAAHWANHKMVVTRGSLEWRRLGGFGWHRVKASDVTEVVLSPGNVFNQAIIVLRLHDGRRIEAGMPNVSEGERDQAFELFRKGVEEANNPAEP